MASTEAFSATPRSLQSDSSKKSLGVAAKVGRKPALQVQHQPATLCKRVLARVEEPIDLPASLAWAVLGDWAADWLSTDLGLAAAEVATLHPEAVVEDPFLPASGGGPGANAADAADAADAAGADSGANALLFVVSLSQDGLTREIRSAADAATHPLSTRSKHIRPLTETLISQNTAQMLYTYTRKCATAVANPVAALAADVTTGALFTAAAADASAAADAAADPDADADVSAAAAAAALASQRAAAAAHLSALQGQGQRLSESEVVTALRPAVRRFGGGALEASPLALTDARAPFASAYPYVGHVATFRVVPTGFRTSLLVWEMSAQPYLPAATTTTAGPAPAPAASSGTPAPLLVATSASHSAVASPHAHPHGVASLATAMRSARGSGSGAPTPTVAGAGAGAGAPPAGPARAPSLLSVPSLAQSSSSSASGAGTDYPRRLLSASSASALSSAASTAGDDEAEPLPVRCARAEQEVWFELHRSMQCCLPFARAALALAADALPQAEREGFASPPRVVADVEDSLRSAGPEAFVQGLSAQWDRVVAALARPGAGASGAAGQGAAQVLSAATTTLPLLVSALTATAEAVEAHEKKAAENRAARKRSPLVPPLEPFNPVRFVAAFLVRHHPSLGAPIAGAQVNAYAGTLARILEAARAGVSA